MMSIAPSLSLRRLKEKERQSTSATTSVASDTFILIEYATLYTTA
jgi:hypothetical protein